MTALEAAADDDTRDTEERSHFKRIAAGLRGFGAQVAIAALGTAGGNLLNG